MIVLMQCVAEAVASKGLRGLMEIVPGGGFLYDVAGDALRRLRERKRFEQMKDEVIQAATASFEDAKAAAEQVVREVAPDASSEERIALEMYLTQLPGAVRQSLKRTDDPSGRSVPANFALNEPADLLRRLPAKVPHFRPGDPLPGKSGWQLVELLGTGGFGEVWLARNPALSALKGAVKFGLDPQARERLLRHEGTLVNRVMEQGKHPNVVTLLDAHLEGDTPWLMYEYIPGGDLTGLILSWQSLAIEDRVKQTVAALKTLASAVGHFHRLSPPLVHRDLKPANILVSDESRAMSHEDRSGAALVARHSSLVTLKVADFGIGGVAAAASLAHEASRRSTGALMSQLWGSYTPLYASPQQQAGNAPDPRDDVHALGVIGFQMLTGKLDATLGADYAKTLRRLGVPEALIELLGDCAAHDPENRPKDAVELAERLAALTTRDLTALGSPAPATQSEPSTSDTLLLTCPSCGASRRLPAEVSGKRIRCSGCQHIFTANAPVAAVPAARPAATKPVTARPVAKPKDSQRERYRNDEPRPERMPPPARQSPPWLYIALGSVGAVLVLVVLGRLLFNGGGTGTNINSPSPTADATVAGPTMSGPPPKPRPRDPAAKIEKAQSFPAPIGELGRPTSLAFSPDGRQLITAFETGSTQMIDAESGNVSHSITSANGTHAAVSTDGLLGVQIEGDTLNLLRWTGKTSTTSPLIGFDDEPAHTAFTSDNRWVLAGGGKTGWVKAWSIASPAKPVMLVDKLGAMTTHDGPVTAIAADPRSRFVATAGEDNTVKVWEPNEKWRTRVSLTTTTRPTALAFSGDGKKLFIGLSDGSLRGWESEKGTEFAARDKKLGPVKQLIPGRSDRHLVGIDATGAAWVYDHGLQAGPWEINGQGKVNAVAFANLNEKPFALDIMASAGEDGTVQIWELFFNNVRAKVFVGKPVTALAFSTDGKRLATATADGTITIWTITSITRGVDGAVEIR